MYIIIIQQRRMKRIKNGSEIVIPGSDTTGGHVTVMQVKRWKEQLDQVMKSAPKL